MSETNNNDILKELIGLGESSSKKSYYPKLQEKIEELEEERRKFWEIFEYSPIGIIQMDFNHSIIMLNQSFIKILNIDLDADVIELYKNDFWSLFESKEIENSFFETLQKNGEVKDFETVIVLKLDKNLEKRVEILINSKLSEARKECFELYIQDITQTKKLKNQLLQSQKLESIGTLSAGIAHDFNNILSVIRGNIDFAGGVKNDNNELVSIINEIDVATQKAQDIVAQLLSFSRKNSVEKTAIYINSIIKESIKLLRASIPKNIDIVQDLDLNEEAILANPTQIHQIIINLVTNASHAMEKKGGKITIKTQIVYFSSLDSKKYIDLKEGCYLKLSIIDTGHGIPPSIKDKIFDPYFTTKEVGKGTGMGLSVVLGIVKNHLGAIDLYTEEGKGSEFKIYFPLIKERPKEYIKKNNSIIGGNEKILLVDDEESLLKIEKKILQKLGYTVFDFSNPINALEYFKQHVLKIDLVISDLTMPKMSGEELSVEISKLSETPIIICTGFSNQTDSSNIKNIKKYIEKPLTIEVLAFSIRDILSKYAK
ncbi:response regulator [bacterium]|nr:response regulator [bacterium]